MGYTLPFVPSIGPNRVALGKPNMTPIVWYDDFSEPCSVDFSATANTGRYYMVGTNAAAVATTNILPVATDGGKLQILTTAASGDENFARLNSLPFLFASSTSDPRPIEVEYRATIDTITTSNQYFGTGDVNTVTAADPVDVQPVGFGFKIASGALQYMYKTSAVTVAATAFSPAVAITAAQVVHLRISWDGIDTLRFYMDGNVLLTVGLAAFTAAAITPCFGIDTASAVAKGVTLDWGYMAQAAPKAGR